MESAQVPPISGVTVFCRAVQMEYRMIQTVVRSRRLHRSHQRMFNVPTYFNMTGADLLIDANCALGTGGAGAIAHYQVLDQNGLAMSVAGMTPREDLSQNGIDWGQGFQPFSTPQQTTSSGTLNDNPVGTCFGPSIPSNNVCAQPTKQNFDILMNGMPYAHASVSAATLGESHRGTVTLTPRLELDSIAASDASFDKS
jgi:hypothetical protein